MLKNDFNAVIASAAKQSRQGFPHKAWICACFERFFGLLRHFAPRKDEERRLFQQALKSMNPEPTSESQTESRRPLASRSSGLAQKAVAALLKTSITPNQISILSIVFALVGAFALLHAPAVLWLYLVAALCVQLRLVCNLLDGMVALEGGRGSPVGSLYNEIPDRIADSLFLVAWGYAAGQDLLGWAAALAAAVTAYIRVLGGALGQKQDFRGPMAKQHRMAALTVICVASMLETWIRGGSNILGVGLWIVTIGAAWTCVARTLAIARRMNT